MCSVTVADGNKTRCFTIPQGASTAWPEAFGVVIASHMKDGGSDYERIGMTFVVFSKVLTLCSKSITSTFSKMIMRVGPRTSRFTK
jgi:hypothetical protein